MNKTDIRDKHQFNTQVDEWVPHAHEISIETVINILIQKKVCTADEIFHIENNLLEQEIYKTNDHRYVTIKNPKYGGKYSNLKKKMSKKRWSRKLGTILFGWKWKKTHKKKNIIS